MERTCWRGATRVWPAATGSVSAKAMAYVFFNRIRLGAMSQNVQGCSVKPPVLHRLNEFELFCFSRGSRGHSTSIPELGEGDTSNLNSTSQFGCVEMDIPSTDRANNATVSLCPTDCLMKLVDAVRTWEIQTHV